MATYFSLSKNKKPILCMRWRYRENSFSPRLPLWLSFQIFSNIIPDDIFISYFIKNNKSFDLRKKKTYYFWLLIFNSLSNFYTALVIFCALVGAWGRCSPSVTPYSLPNMVAVSWEIDWNRQTKKGQCREHRNRWLIYNYWLLIMSHCYKNSKQNCFHFSK